MGGALVRDRRVVVNLRAGDAGERGGSAQRGRQVRFACPTGKGFNETRLACARKCFGEAATVGLAAGEVALVARSNDGEDFLVDSAAAITADMTLVVSIGRAAAAAVAELEASASGGTGGAAAGGAGQADAPLQLGDVSVSRLPETAAGEFRDTNIILVGASGVGKSALLLRVSRDRFVPTYVSTIGTDFKILKLALGDDVMLKMLIWDSSGQDRFNSISEGYVKSVAGVLVVFDVTDRPSFEAARAWLARVAELNPGVVARHTVALVGNKADAAAGDGAGAGGAPDRRDPALPPRVVTAEEAAEASAVYGAPFFEASAKAGNGVDAPFHFLALKLGTVLVPPADQERVRKRTKDDKCNIL